MQELIEQGAVALSRAIAAKQVSAEEVMTATLAQIERWNGAVNAIVSLRDPDELMAEARAADATAPIGWLHGIPLAVKDLANVEGLPTSRGSPLFEGQIANADDVFVSRLRAAGAIFIGKTNTPEFGLGSHTFNPVHGRTRNPYDRSRSAGGSSGGAAVALATGMLSVADGSDMMGSLRNPAGWNNVYGMRPSFGLVPNEPVGDTFLNQLATSGPMARAPHDLAAMLGTMAGPDPRVPHAVGSEDFAETMDKPLAGLRIGWLDDWGGAYPFEPGIRECVSAALNTFKDLGHTVVSCPPPFDAAALWDSWTTLRSFAIAGNLAPVYENPELRAKLKDSAAWETARGLSLTAMDVHKASVIRSRWFEAAAALFQNFDALVLPSAQMWPFDVEIDYPAHIEGHAMDTYHRWMEVVIPAGLVGLPVVNLPCGFGGPHDLPMGFQLIGPRQADARLLQIAQAWHTATDWPEKRRPTI